MKRILYPFSDWSHPNFFTDSVNIGALKIISSVASSKNLNTGVEVCVNSSKLNYADAKRSAYQELLKKITAERFSSLPEVNLPTAHSSKFFTYSKTNGVAIHFRKARACENAKFELIERDRVLRCWYGHIIPQKLQLPLPLDAKLGMFYHISKYLFRDSADPYYTIGYFGFPKDSEKHPLFFGFGSAASLQTAGRKAADEAITRLSRLWNQPIPHKLPIFAPTANFHQDYFSHPANHEKIREWLSGRNSEQRLFFKPEYKVVKDYAIDYFDITPPEFKKKFFVVKAVSAQAIPLWFGIPDAFLGVSSDRISIHPIA